MNFFRRKELIIPLIVVVGVVAVVWFISQSAEKKTADNFVPTNVPVVADKSKATVSATLPKPTEVTINSTKLASNYFVYEKSEYDKARSANRPILLFFYANWCPTCARQEPINVTTFNNFGQTNLIAFRVNFNDSETSNDEKKLAMELGVTYQHTFLTFDSTGKQVERFLGDTKEEELKSKIQKVL